MQDDKLLCASIVEDAIRYSTNRYAENIEKAKHSTSSNFIPQAAGSGSDSTLQSSTLHAKKRVSFTDQVATFWEPIHSAAGTETSLDTSSDLHSPGEDSLPAQRTFEPITLEGGVSEAASQAFENIGSIATLNVFRLSTSSDDLVTSNDSNDPLAHNTIIFHRKSAQTREI